jgi:3-dehydroquinate synthase
MSVVISSISESLKTFLGTKSYSKIIVLTDTSTKRFCYPIVKEFLPKHISVTVKNNNTPNMSKVMLNKKIVL